MTTLNEILYSLWLKLTPLISDDSTIDERQIIHFINSQRSLWIRNEYNKNPRTLDDAVVQSLGAVEMEVVDRIEGSPYIGGSSKILKSKVEIPVAIELHNSTLLTRISPLDIVCTPFKFVDYSNIPYVGKGKFNKNIIFVFLKDKHIYLLSDCNNPAWKVIKYINIRGIFENPIEVGRFRELDGTPCWTPNSAYPINKWMLPYIEAEIMKGDLKFFMNIQIDESNNANPLNEQLNNTTK